MTDLDILRAALDDMIRAFNPDQPRGPNGRWVKVGALLNELQKEVGDLANGPDGGGDNSDLDGLSLVQLREVADREGIPLRKSDSRAKAAQTIKDLRFKKTQPAMGFGKAGTGAPSGPAAPKAPKTKAPRPSLPSSDDDLTKMSLVQLRQVADSEGIPIRKGDNRAKAAQTIRDIRFKRTQPAQGFGRT